KDPSDAGRVGLRQTPPAPARPKRTALCPPLIGPSRNPGRRKERRRISTRPSAGRNDHRPTGRGQTPPPGARSAQTSLPRFQRTVLKAKDEVVLGLCPKPHRGGCVPIPLRIPRAARGETLLHPPTVETCTTTEEHRWMVLQTVDLIG